MAGKITLHTVKKIAIGGYRQMGLLPKLVLYVMLISLCFVYQKGPHRRTGGGQNLRRRVHRTLRRCHWIPQRRKVG